MLTRQQIQRLAQRRRRFQSALKLKRTRSRLFHSSFPGSFVV